MKLERLQLRGFSDAFPGLVDISFRDLGPGLVALVGLNGKGKTTLIEASGPAAIYRQLPSRQGEDPVSYATSRESFIDLEYAIDDRGRFRSRLNMDGPKRQTDAVLEAIASDGSRAPLNREGQRSTYDAAIKERFPSIDLFLNSAFCAQGRGDEFTRRKGSARKELFAEMLALGRYLAMAKTAGDAADVCDDARRRLEARIDAVQRDTVSAIGEAIAREAAALQVRGGAAAARQLELAATIVDLEAREKLAADQVAAFTAAQQRVQAADRAIGEREAERTALDQHHQAADATFDDELAQIQKALASARQAIDTQRHNADAALDQERTQIRTTRDRECEAIDAKLAGNAQIRVMEANIRAAVVALPAVEADLEATRADIAARQAAQRGTAAALRDAERALAALVPVEQRLDRTQTDAGLLRQVPCGGAGDYAACRLLVNAQAAEAQIPALTQQLQPKLVLADQVAQLTRDGEAHTDALEALHARLATLESAQKGHAELAKYHAPLEAADARVAALQGQRHTTCASADEQLAAAARRHSERVAELETRSAATARDTATQQDSAKHRHATRAGEIDAQRRTLEATIARLAAERQAAVADLKAVAAGNSEAVELQAQLAAARADRDAVVAELAAVAAERAALDRRRADLQQKRAQLADLEGRRRRVEQELLDWRDHQKALGKGGLPDLLIDEAGPDISARCNQLLEASYGPRFTLQLVTQVPKADGSGYKDEFTVQVLDNEAPARGWKDLYFLSGGERTVVQEAFMCAICLYVNERSPLPMRTLWRDESGAALDPVNAIRYVTMLRKVREIGGFHQVLFISHNPAAAALADAQIQVGGGTARIVLPPYADRAEAAA